MNVFILVGKVDFEFDDVMGVYSKTEKAKSAIDSEDLLRYDSFSIEEWDPDNGIVSIIKRETRKNGDRTSASFVGDWEKTK